MKKEGRSEGELKVVGKVKGLGAMGMTLGIELQYAKVFSLKNNTGRRRHR